MYFGQIRGERVCIAGKKKKEKKDSKALAPKVKEKEKEGRCSPKKVVKKESYFATKMRY